MISPLHLGRTLLLAFALLLASCAPAAPQGPVLLAASSMQEAMEEMADSWEARGHPRPVLSFSSSAVVARQALEGAPADIVLTADAEWMDVLGESGQLRSGTRRNVAGNTLVLVGPVNGVRASDPASNDAATLLRAFDGRLAIAEPRAVPAGRYAMAALQNLGIADRLQDRIVPAENVRAALALVERGEADMGIVYASDARASNRVNVLARFSPQAHPPIIYPAAVLARSSSPQAEALVEFIASAEGQAILARHGFTRPA